MSYKPPPKPAVPLAQALAEFETALAATLQAAITAGATGQGGAQAAERGLAKVSAALEQVRRSERAQAREYAANGIKATLGGSLHSAAARGNHAVDWPAAIDEALDALRKATW